MLSNCGLGEDSWESLELQGDQTNPKGDQPWIFTGRTDTEAEASILWPPYVKSWHIGKDPEPGKDWGQEKKGVTEDEMVRWHHWLNGHELSKLQEMVKGREVWHAAVHGVTESRTWLSDWTTNIYNTRVPPVTSQDLSPLTNLRKYHYKNEDNAVLK